MNSSQDASTPTFLLIPGAGGRAWYWHRVVPELDARGVHAIAVQLPADDDTAGLTEYVDVVVEAAGDARPLVVVAQSMGGLTAPLVCTRLPVDLVVLVNAMVPAPGETGGQWWDATGQAEARAELAAREGRELSDDPFTDFFHDVPPDVVADAERQGEPAQSAAPFAQPWPLAAWPAVPTRVVAGRDDRFFPPDFQRRIAQRRLGITPDELPGGHLIALSRPVELADRLCSFWREVATSESEVG